MEEVVPVTKYVKRKANMGDVDMNRTKLLVQGLSSMSCQSARRKTDLEKQGKCELGM